MQASAFDWPVTEILAPPLPDVFSSTIFPEFLSRPGMVCSQSRRGREKARETCHRPTAGTHLSLVVPTSFQRCYNT